MLNTPLPRLSTDSIGGLSSPTVNWNHTRLRLQNLVFCGANACSDRKVMQLAGEVRYSAHGSCPCPRLFGNHHLQHLMAFHGGLPQAVVAVAVGHRRMTKAQALRRLDRRRRLRDAAPGEEVERDHQRASHRRAHRARPHRTPARSPRSPSTACAPTDSVRREHEAGRGPGRGGGAAAPERGATHLRLPFGVHRAPAPHRPPKEAPWSMVFSPRALDTS